MKRDKPSPEIIATEHAESVPPAAPPLQPTKDALTMSLWPEAGRALGLGRSLTYQLANSGRFPVRILRLGSKLRVSRAELARYLDGNSSQEVA
jgi:predicted DNA-binding transcriptional regulator AlpA